ncbi:MAG: RNA polymerase sigma factor [Actinomycetota bacterium]
MRPLNIAAPEWPDRDLVIAFKAGERWAYDEMYRRYGTRVSSICRRMLVNVEDAHEATQETFLKAYQGLPRFNGNYKLGAWLTRIAANVCLDYIRSRSRRASLVPLPDHDSALEFDPGPEEIVAGDYRAISTLEEIQPLHARALSLRAIEGMSHKEMADRLEMSPAQVKALLHRARDSFKKAWENASGWIAAPVIALRSLMSSGEKSGPTGAHMVVMSSSTAPLLAEKVAASAIVVATALGGASIAAADMSSQENVRAALSKRATAAAAETPASTIESKVTPMAKQSGEVDKVVALLADIQRSTQKKNDDDKQKSDDGGSEEGPDPRRAGTKLVKSVKEQVEDLLR